MESPLHERAPADLRVIETLRYEPDSGFHRLPLHLDRAGRTCERLRIPFDHGACATALRGAVGETAARCRLTIDLTGCLEVTTAPLASNPPRWRVMVSSTRLDSRDPWLGVKTTVRRLYDESRAGLPRGVDEAIFLNEVDEVCEGTITNVFARIGEQLVTPPLRCGLLPGILRHELLESGTAVERILGLEDLRQAEAVFVGNSLRGLIPADLI